MREDREDDAFAILSSIEQILDDVELAVKATDECGVDKGALDKDDDNEQSGGKSPMRRGMRLVLFWGIKLHKCSHQH